MRLAATTTAAAASTAAAVAVPSAPTEPQALPIEAHFDRVRANLIRCEECNENFFFDFLRHPRYFVAHFKACHLKNVLYRFNGVSEEENQRIRFGPRRKKDATTWFSQLKSTEKRMVRGTISLAAKQRAVTGCRCRRSPCRTTSGARLPRRSAGCAACTVR